jgi:hypothetical protein
MSLFKRKEDPVPEPVKEEADKMTFDRGLLMLQGAQGLSHGVAMMLQPEKEQVRSYRSIVIKLSL